jgi:hypothetical protein
MQNYLFRKLLLLAIIFGILGSNTTVSLAMQLGEVVPNCGIYAKVKPGEIVPNLDELYNSNNVNIKVKFNKKPAIIVAIHGYIDVEKLLAIQSFYEKNKRVMDVYVISHMDTEQMDFFVKQYNIKVPFYFAPTLEFTNKFNNSSPALIIIDQNRTVRYNGQYNIDVKALEEYMEKLIAGQTEEEPLFTYVPAKTISSVPKPRYVNQPPPLLEIGEKLKVDDFQVVNDEPIRLENGKPTMLWFYLSITLNEHFVSMLPVLESLGKNRGVNVYPVCVGDSKELINETMKKYHYSMPVLKTHNNLRYSWVFPCIAIFDEQGILRYRSSDDIDIKKLEGIIDGLKSK